MLRVTFTQQQGKPLACDVLLRRNQADKPRVRRRAERQRAAGLRQNNFGLRISDFGFPPKPALSPAALGSDGVALERSTVRRTG